MYIVPFDTNCIFPNATYRLRLTDVSWFCFIPWLQNKMNQLLSSPSSQRDLSPLQFGFFIAFSLFFPLSFLFLLFLFSEILFMQKQWAFSLLHRDTKRILLKNRNKCRCFADSRATVRYLVVIHSFFKSYLWCVIPREFRSVEYMGCFGTLLFVCGHLPKLLVIYVGK